MKNCLLYDLHRSRGARLQPESAPSPLLTYGDVPGEYEAATRGAALFDETDRGLVVARGEEAGAFLHRLLANDVLGLEPAQGNRNLLLSAKGKVRFVVDLRRAGGEFLLSTEPGEASALLEALDTYHFTEAVELEDASERHAPLSILGPGAAPLLSALFGQEPPNGDHQSAPAELAGTALTITALPLHGSRAWRLDAGPGGAEALWEALVAAGARPAGRVVADSLRVEAGVGRAGEDVDDAVYPQEARLDPAFSLEKGCYVGQEVVAKIDTYGGLNKRLVALEVSHDDPVPRGARLARQDPGRDEWRNLGLVTSWAYSFVLDGGLVLAYVKRRHQAPGTTFRLDDGPATATVVPLPVRPDALPPAGEFE